jgi:BirA family biotin operon repressor/biotin-[acetyl-CoA-carboxylase] ligase
MSELNTQKILLLRDHHGEQVDVEVVAETGSTNADLMARLHELQAPVLRIAEHQTAGRGRAGRVWHSISGGVLTFSLAWHILKEQKKLAGVLIETSSHTDNGSWAVIGVGLNLTVPDALELEIGQAVADAPWLAQMDRNLLVARLLNALAKAMDEFRQYGFATFAERWNKLHAFAGQAVLVLDRGQVLHEGVALGVDHSGCLVLQTAQGQVTVVAGDVSLRTASNHQESA